MKPASVKSRVLGRLVSVLLVPVILSSSVTTVYVSADDEVVVDVVEDDTVLDAPVDGQIDDTQDTTDIDVNDETDDASDDSVAQDDSNDEASEDVVSDDVTTGDVVSDDSTDISDADTTNGSADDQASDEVTDGTDGQNNAAPLEDNLLNGDVNELDAEALDAEALDAEELDEEALLLENKTRSLKALKFGVYEPQVEDTVNVEVSVELVDSDEFADSNAITVTAGGNTLENGSNTVDVVNSYSDDGELSESNISLALSNSNKDLYEITSICWNGEEISEEGLKTLDVKNKPDNTLCVKFKCLDTDAPEINVTKMPTASVTLSGTYYSHAADALMISAQVTDDKAGIKEVQFLSDYGSAVIESDSSEYSWAPSENGFYQITGIYAKDNLGRENTVCFDSAVWVCFYNVDDGSDLSVSLSDYEWHSTAVNDKLTLTVSADTYQEVASVEINGEIVGVESSRNGLFGKSHFEKVIELPETDGETEYTVSKINFANGNNIVLRDKTVTAKIDNTKPAGVITAKADVQPVTRTESLAEWIVALYNKVILGYKKVNVTYIIPKTADSYSGLKELKFNVAKNGVECSDPVKLQLTPNGDNYIACDTFWCADNEEITYELTNSIYLIDNADNESELGAVTIDADFDLVVFDWAAPNINYSYGSGVYSESGDGSTIHYFDAPLNGTIEIDDTNLGDNVPVITNKTNSPYGKGVSVDTQNYRTEQDVRRDKRVYNFSASEEGEYYFNTKMTDISGHSGDKDTDIFRVDLNAPDVNVTLESASKNSSAEGSGKEYFGDAVTVKAVMTEKWPVIGSCQVTVTGETADGAGVSITETFSESGSETHTLSIPGLADGTYTLSVKALDKAGHSFANESNYKTFIVDTKAPEVKLTFDTYDARNGKYYNVPRTATITVTDYTFEEGRAQLDLNQEYGTADQGAWSNPSRNVYEKTIKFDRDGIYSLVVKCTDMVDKASNVEEEREFYIDRTAPEISVAYDNNNAKNGFYFKDARTAFVKVKDLSFSDDLIQASSQSGDGFDSLPSLGGFDGSGMEHTGRIHFDVDGKYGYTIRCEDLAGNVYSGYSSDVFVIDTSAPEVKFAGVENFSANNGVVAPSVTYVDRYMDMNATTVTMTGSNNGPVTIGSQVAPTENGFVVSYADFEHVKSMDDLYTLEAAVYDLAGNETKEQLVFSVNRFGSVFVLGDAAKALNRDYYTREPKDISITEINIDELTYKNVSISRDGDIKELKNGKQYQVTKQGSDTSWKTYTYTIGKKNFDKDGIYSVTVYTKDRATNVQDNKSRDAEVNFAVDKTAPSIVTAGLEEGGVYKETSHVVNIDVTDNMGVTSLTVLKDGKEIETYDAEALETAGGVESITLDESEKRQTITLVAEDVAGNVETVVYSNVLVSTKEEKPAETVAQTETETGTGSGTDTESKGDLPDVWGAVRPEDIAIYIVLALGIVAAGAGAGFMVYKKKGTGSEK